MEINIADVPFGKNIDDYPEDTIFVWKHRISPIPFQFWHITKDKITIDPNEYRAFDLIDYMEKNNIKDEELTYEELESFRIKD